LTQALPGRRAFVERAKSRAILWLHTPSIGWRIAGFGIFLLGLGIGTRLEGWAMAVALAAFIVLTPLLVLAGLFYEFQTEPNRILPGFKTLLLLMFLCWIALEIFALGTFAFGWSTIARLVLLVMMAGSIALVIFAQLLKLKPPVPPAE
jgi:hypothetical protein